jgi:hypothetical protein
MYKNAHIIKTCILSFMPREQTYKHADIITLSKCDMLIIQIRGVFFVQP